MFTPCLSFVDGNYIYVAIITDTSNPCTGKENVM